MRIKVCKCMGYSYNPNISHLKVGYNPLILTIYQHFLGGFKKTTAIPGLHCDDEESGCKTCGWVIGSHQVGDG